MAARVTPDIVTAAAPRLDDRFQPAQRALELINGLYGTIWKVVCATAE
jgi:hypothetical protein